MQIQLLLNRLKQDAIVDSGEGSYSSKSPFSLQRQLDLGLQGLQDANLSALTHACEHYAV